jgi:hypothetical protein
MFAELAEAGAEFSFEGGGGMGMDGGAGFDGGGGGGDFGESLDGGDGGESAVAPVEGAESTVDVAEQGFSGTPMALPYKEQLERQFGISLDGVEAYGDDNAQHANSRLGAAAYASGNRIAFATTNPDISLVAHEVTHTLQQTGTGGAKSGGDGGGIETSGEAEAERVESAVVSGKPAAGALDRDPRAAAPQAPGAAAKGPAPALKRAGQRPALSGFSSGQTFSPTGLEQSGSYKLWSARGIRVPIAAVPGLFFVVSPSVSVAVNGGVNWRNASVTAQLVANGSVGVGLSYGDPALAEIYANMEASAGGRFRYERSRAPAATTGTQRGTQPATRPRDTWSLEGYFSMQTSFNVGVKVGGGIIHKRFQFGNTELGRLTGVSWRDGRFQRERLGWQWGPIPQAFFREVNAQIQRARQIQRMGREAAQRAWQGVASTTNWIYNGTAGLFGRR